MNLKFRGRLVQGVATCALAGSLLAAAAGCGQASGGPSSHDQAVSLVGYKGPVVVSADGRTITVGGFPYPCFGTVQPVARETAGQVRLWLRYVAPSKPGVCDKDVALVITRTIHLKHPVGSRTVVDGASRHRLASFDGHRTLRLTKVPAGYHFQYISPVVLAGGPLLGPAEQSGCSQLYSSGKVALTIVQASSHLRLTLPQGRHPVAITVLGHAGQATTNEITWREHGLSVLILVNATGSARQVMTTRQLIALADSAR
jgi:hypothetical protein